jgi:hypothetical protein
MQEETNACAQTSCNCQVAKEGEFCSEYCLETREVTEIGCGCEHPTCLDQL